MLISMNCNKLGTLSFMTDTCNPVYLLIIFSTKLQISRNKKNTSNALYPRYDLGRVIYVIKYFGTKPR